MKNKYILTALTVFFGVVIMYLFTNVIFKTNNDEKLKIGFLYNADPATAYTQNFLHAKIELEDYFGDKVDIYEKFNLGERPVELENAIEYFVSEGCKIIFAISYGHGPICKKMAEKYPDVQFCHLTGDLVSSEPVLDNYHAAMGAIHEGRYVCGVVAGMKLKELILSGKIKRSQAKIGYVAAFPYAEVISGYTAFYLGVKSVVPEAQMIVRYTNTWSNHIIEKKCAEKLIDEGCVIISQHADTAGAATACEEARIKYGKTVYHVGYNQSMTDVAPTASLVSCRIKWSPYIIGACEAVMKHKKIEAYVKSRYKTNDACEGFNKDWLEIVGLNRHILAPGTEEEIQRLIKLFKTNSISVFKGNYIGVNPYDESDIWDLQKPFIECEKRSSPSFCYVLREGIEIRE